MGKWKITFCHVCGVEIAAGHTHCNECDPNGVAPIAVTLITYDTHPTGGNTTSSGPDRGDQGGNQHKPTAS